MCTYLVQGIELYRTIYISLCLYDVYTHIYYIRFCQNHFFDNEKSYYRFTVCSMEWMRITRPWKGTRLHALPVIAHPSSSFAGRKPKPCTYFVFICFSYLFLFHIRVFITTIYISVIIASSSFL